MHSRHPGLLTLGLAQIAPVYLHRDSTLAKVNQFVRQAAHQGCQLVTFGEALVPGYPFWPDLTNGARFNSPLQKSIFAEYSAEAVQLEAGHLDTLCATAAELHIAIYLGCIERPAGRGGHSLYCSLVYINQHGEIASVHRKLMPTYEERLVWSPGDGHGLRTHPLGPFRVGGLNCLAAETRAQTRSPAEDSTPRNTFPGPASRSRSRSAPVLHRPKSARPRSGRNHGTPAQNWNSGDARLSDRAFSACPSEYESLRSPAPAEPPREFA